LAAAVRFRISRCIGYSAAIGSGFTDFAISSAASGIFPLVFLVGFIDLM